MVKKDKIIIITTGRWSDYSILGCFRAIKDFNPRELFLEFIRKKGIQLKSYETFETHFELEEFVHWLLFEKKVIEEITYLEWRFDYFYEDSQYSIISNKNMELESQNSEEDQIVFNSDDIQSFYIV